MREIAPAVVRWCTAIQWPLLRKFFCTLRPTVDGRSETHVVPILTSGIAALPSFNPALANSVLALGTLTRDGIRFGLFQPILQDPIHDFWLLNC